MEINWNEVWAKIFINKDEKAFQKLFLHFYNDLVHFSNAIVGDLGLAEDIVSDIMLAIWNGKIDYKSIKNVKTYLFKATKNRSLNTINRDKIHLKYVHSKVITEYASSPEQLLIDKELKDLLDNAINNLPEKTKMAFVLVKDNLLTYQEVADIMNISKNTVDRHIQIAFQKIKSTLSILKS
ncbi:RNA polymerase sigma-70 factor [Sphingobacterium bovisgrunnientis]|uniref:RNA polymerase sigma-70 factor n=1 Tax=Sphingobacterium bovisgrunnientis TaxID=1874697 RepID=UPI00135885A9|nr:RNA polymerase sigma-70 factor [Sphingobacterium bovisgrunnientis]